MVTRLSPLRLLELSLVDNPANKASVVTIFKRDTDGGRKEKPMNSFDDEVERIVKRDGVSRLDAMKRARVSNPAAFAAYQSDPAVDRQLTKAAEPPTPVTAFMSAVDEIVLKRGCSRTEAMSIARRADPAAFKQFMEC